MHAASADIFCSLQVHCMLRCSYTYTYGFHKIFLCHINNNGTVPTLLLKTMRLRVLHVCVVWASVYSDGYVYTNVHVKENFRALKKYFMLGLVDAFLQFWIATHFWRIKWELSSVLNFWQLISRTLRIFRTRNVIEKHSHANI